MSALNRGHGKASVMDNDTVFPYLDMITNRCSFNDRVGTDVDMVANLHRIIVEIATIRLVRGSIAGHPVDISSIV
jgi:hypothetical protein